LGVETTRDNGFKILSLNPAEVAVPRFDPEIIVVASLDGDEFSFGDGADVFGFLEGGKAQGGVLGDDDAFDPVGEADGAELDETEKETKWNTGKENDFENPTQPGLLNFTGGEGGISGQRENEQREAGDDQVSGDGGGGAEKDLPPTVGIGFESGLFTGGLQVVVDVGVAGRKVAGAFVIENGKAEVSRFDFRVAEIEAERGGVTVRGDESLKKFGGVVVMAFEKGAISGVEFGVGTIGEERRGEEEGGEEEGSTEQESISRSQVVLGNALAEAIPWPISMK